MLDKICQLARCAGSTIMNFYNSQQCVKISYKIDKTPVTNVDYQAHQIIQKGLLLITPNIPIISEEHLYSFKICSHWDNYWLIDPLDGTKEFLKKNGEFTVNISLIQNGRPVLGVIYAPFFDVLYSSFNKEAWKETKIGLKQKIHVSQADIPLFITSRSHSDPELHNYLERQKHYKIQKLGSSLKFCLIAEGTAQVYARFGNTHIWDTAAGDAIVTAAGGYVYTSIKAQKPLNYLLSSRSSFVNSGFYASAS